MRLEAISMGRDPPREVNVVVEVPVGGEPIKYEMDKASGALVVDRFLYTSMRYPGNYGFIPHTLSEDGDPCDVLVANQRGVQPGAVIAVRPVGVLKMQDFFEHYKDLETTKWVKVLGWGDAAEAQEFIMRSYQRAKAAKTG